jgi:hypothetical protein
MIHAVAIWKNVFKGEKNVFLSPKIISHTHRHVKSYRGRDFAAPAASSALCSPHPKSSSRGYAHLLFSKHPSSHPQLPPTKNHGNPVLRRRLSVVAPPPAVWWRWCQRRQATGSTRPSPNRGGRHRPRRRPLQTAHCQLPVRTRSHSHGLMISFNSPPLITGGCKGYQLFGGLF